MSFSLRKYNHLFLSLFYFTVKYDVDMSRSECRCSAPHILILRTERTKAHFIHFLSEVCRVSLKVSREITRRP